VWGHAEDCDEIHKGVCELFGIPRWNVSIEKCSLLGSKGSVFFYVTYTLRYRLLVRCWSFWIAFTLICRTLSLVTLNFSPISLKVNGFLPLRPKYSRNISASRLVRVAKAFSMSFGKNPRYMGSSG